MRPVSIALGVGLLAALSSAPLAAVAGASSKPRATSPGFVLPPTGEFLSPSGNISCEIDWHRSGLPNQVSCQALQLPSSVQLTAGGVEHVCSGIQCLGNPAEGTPTLPYGIAVVRGPFRCVSRTAGVTCTTSARGFRIDRSGVVGVAPTSTAVVGSFKMPSRYRFLSEAHGTAKVLAFDSSGRYAQISLSCGRTATGTALAAGTRWTVDLDSIDSFEVETNLADPAAGSVKSLSRSGWMTLVRHFGWTGALVLDHQPTSFDDGPGVSPCGA